MIEFGKTNIYKIHLYLLRNIFEDGLLDRILNPIGEAIQNCKNNISGTLSSNNEDYTESVAEYEREIIENLLGTAFVACQTYITRIVSRIISLHEYHNNQKKQKKLITTGNKKIDILSFGDKLKNIKYTNVQLIESFANYYKHRDQWRNWDRPTKENAQTLQIIMSVGLESGSSDNLRKAAEILGNSEYKNTEIFYDTIYNWCKNIYNKYYSELKKLNLV